MNSEWNSFYKDLLRCVLFFQLLHNHTILPLLSTLSGSFISVVHPLDQQCPSTPHIHTPNVCRWDTALRITADSWLELRHFSFSFMRITCTTPSHPPHLTFNVSMKCALHMLCILWPFCIAFQTLYLRTVSLQHMFCAIHPKMQM